MPKNAAPATVDEYISSFTPEVQAVLEQVRQAVRRAAPDAKECISYQIPALRQRGILVYFAAFKKHIGFYPPVKGDPKAGGSGGTLRGRERQPALSAGRADAPEADRAPDAAAAAARSGARRAEEQVMKIAASVSNSPAGHEVAVRTGENTQSLVVPAKPFGAGSGINGGEFLMLALATCYCNDLYREAARLNIAIDGVRVEASATFAGIGLAATDIRYQAQVSSPAAPELIADLLRQTDAVAEVHNTLRAGVPVVLSHEGAP